MWTITCNSLGVRHDTNNFVQLFLNRCDTSVSTLFYILKHVMILVCKYISISCLFQAQEENGETSFVRVEDPNATWLTMLRPAPSESVRNTSVFYKGR